MTRSWLSGLLISIGLIGTPIPLLAHSFDIAVIAPFSGPGITTGESLWQGMRVATREADGHAHETSDGHLGGVDSNLLRIDSNREAKQIEQALGEVDAGQAVIIIVLGPEQTMPIKSLPLARPAIIVLTGPQPSIVDNTMFSPRALTEDQLRNFNNAYHQQYDLNANATARRGYAAARLIAAAIRAVDGDLANPDRVSGSFTKALADSAN